MRLPFNVSAEILDVKEEYAVAGDVNSGGINLRSAGKEACKVLKLAIESFCPMHDVPSQVLVEAMEHSGEDVFEGVQT